MMICSNIAEQQANSLTAAESRMTKIGLISDTHSYLDPKIFGHFKDCDEIWHAGDIGSDAVANALENFKPFRAVYGNVEHVRRRRKPPFSPYDGPRRAKSLNAKKMILKSATASPFTCLHPRIMEDRATTFESASSLGARVGM